MDRLRFWVNDVSVEESSAGPTTTLLQYLRYRLGLTGSKEGCAEGDCGACTVAVLDAGRGTFRAVNACLLFLPMLQGKRVYTAEGLRDGGRYHPVQEAMARALGSQCGYCTPGIAMSLFEACYRKDLAEPWQLDDQLCGNLCRCTGYRPIRDAARKVAGRRPQDRFLARLGEAPREPFHLRYAGDGQRYYNPGSLEDLFEVLRVEPDAQLVAGGTDLGLEVTKRFRTLPVLVSLEGIAELRRVERTDTHWHLGAAATLTEIQEAMGGEIPAMEKMLRFFASRQIRNRATLGGNLCTASPIGDMAPVLLALDARVVLRSGAGARSIPLCDFFVAYRKTALCPGEVLEWVEVPHVPPRARATSFKVSKRRELDISAVSAGCFVTLDSAGRVAEARVAFGGMAAMPKRAAAVEAALRGRPWSEATVRAAQDCLDRDFTPISDHRGSAWYRREVARNLLLGFWLETRDRPAPSLAPRPTSTIHAEGTR
jgi:xanthine dehydrogenase small subunit